MSAFFNDSFVPGDLFFFFRSTAGRFLNDSLDSASLWEEIQKLKSDNEAVISLMLDIDDLGASFTVGPMRSAAQESKNPWGVFCQGAIDGDDVQDLELYK